MTHDFAIARLQSINPTLDATAALLSAAGGDFRPLLEFGFELAPHPLGVTLYRGGMGAVVTNPPDTSKVEAAVLGLTNARKPSIPALVDGADVAATIEEATDALDTATSVETMADFKANLDEAAAALRKALACIERLSARCPTE